MTLAELLTTCYAWLDGHALPVLIAAAVIPTLGMIGAWLGRGGRSDRDGRLVADATLWFAVAVCAAEILGLALAQWGFEKGPLDANLLLLLAGPVALAVSLLGIRAIYPLSELASTQTLRDVGLFGGAVVGVFWLFSKFRGWGIVFFGGMLQLLVLLLLVAWLLRFLYRRMRQ